MLRLISVAVWGVLTLLSIGVAAAGLLMRLAAREPGVENSWSTLGLVIAIAGAVVAASSGGRTIWLVIDWRRGRDERSSRP